MADHGLITRRAALVGAITSTAAFAAPVALALDLPGGIVADPMTHAADLAHELADALDAVQFGRWRATVDPRAETPVIFSNEIIRPVAGKTASPGIAWVRAMHDDGFIFTLKAKTYRNDQVVDGDPNEVDDYAIRKAGSGYSDDTELMIWTMQRA
jgi:hypothetical protein